VRPSSASNATRSPELVMLGLALAAVAVAVLLLTSGSLVASQIVGASLAVTLTGLASLALTSRATGIRAALGSGKLGPWSSLSSSIVFGLASLTWVERQSGSAGAISPGSVVTALQLVMVAQGAWLVGYLVGPGAPAMSWTRARLDRLFDATSGGRVEGRGFWPLLAISVIGQALRIATGSFGYLQDASVAVSSGTGYAQLVTLLAAMGTFAVVVAAVQVFSGNRAWRAKLALVVVIQVAAGLLAGNKEPVAMVGIALLLACSVARGTFPLRFLALGLAAFVLVVMPFVTAYRVDVRGQGLGFGAAIQTAPTVARTSAEFGDVGVSREQLQLRLREIDSFAVVVQKTPRTIPYRPVDEYAQAPVLGVIPRAVWPGKPVFAVGYEFARQYYGQDRRTYSSAAITPQGDLWRHGGLPVLLLGMAAIGLGVRYLDGSLRPQRDFRALFFVLTFFPLLVKWELGVVSFLLSLVGLVVTPLVGIWITGLAAPRGRTGHAPRGLDSAQR
jgi:hypothetical protein